MKNYQSDIDKLKPCFSIGSFANLLNINQRTLRIYDEENILNPKRTTSNRRMYSISDYNKAQLILFMTKNLALNLSGVKIILLMLKTMDISEENYLSKIKMLASKAKIDDLKQAENIYKTSKRGRKKKTKIKLFSTLR